MTLDQFDVAKNSSDWRHWFDSDFEIAFFSSNNPKYFTTVGGYVLCQGNNSTENTESIMVQTNFTSENLETTCGNKTVFIPNSPAELAEATESLKSFAPDRGLSKMRVFTDYKRFNKTHFWSEIASQWINLKNDSKGQILILKAIGIVFDVTLSNSLKSFKSQWNTINTIFYFVML